MALSQSSITVLENDSSLSRALERLLQASGFSTRAFANSDDFIQNDAARGAACVVLDETVVGEHRTAVREHLHIGQRVPVIFISGYDDDETHALADATEASACLATPFSGRLLVGTINRLLQEPSERWVIAPASPETLLSPNP